MDGRTDDTQGGAVSAPPPQPDKQDWEVTIGGGTYLLRCNILALAELRRLWGFASDDPALRRLRRLQLSDMPVVFYAFTRRHHKGLGVEEAFNLIDDAVGEDLAGLVPAVKGASDSGFPGARAAGSKKK